MASELSSLVARVKDIVSSAGIDNFWFDDGVLVMCGVRYRVEHCECEDPDCSGLTLNRDDQRAALGTAFAAAQ